MPLKRGAHSLTICSLLFQFLYKNLVRHLFRAKSNIGGHCRTMDLCLALSSQPSCHGSLCRQSRHQSTFRPGPGALHLFGKRDGRSSLSFDCSLRALFICGGNVGPMLLWGIPGNQYGDGQSGQDLHRRLDDTLCQISSSTANDQYN